MLQVSDLRSIKKIKITTTMVVQNNPTPEKLWCMTV